MSDRDVQTSLPSMHIEADCNPTGSDIFTKVLWEPSTMQHGTGWPMRAPGIPVPLKINELSEDCKRTPIRGQDYN